MSTTAVFQLVLHVALCFTLTVICACRLNHDVCRQFKRARLRIVLFMGGALLSMFQPLIFGTFATPSETVVIAVLIACMVLNADRWMQSYGLGQPTNPTDPVPTPPIADAERSTS